MIAKFFNIYKENDHIRICFLGIKISFNFKRNNNKIFLVDKKRIRQIKKINGLKINFKRNNSVVIVNNPLPKFRNCILNLYENCQINIENIDNCNKLHGINNLTIDMVGKNSKISIGKNFYCGSGYIYLDNDSEIFIGNNCMFSNNFQLRCGDSHTIKDLKNNSKNICKPTIRIGNNVWLGINSFILKNTKIPNNSIVGACSVVTRKFSQENIAIAGNPAKIIKEDITWEK